MTRDLPPSAVLIVKSAEADAAEEPPSPQDAPPVDGPAPDEAGDAPARRPIFGFWARLFFWVGGVLGAAMIAFSLERLVVEATEIAPWAGWAMRGLVLTLLGAILVLALRELAALGRVRRIARIRRLCRLTPTTRATRDADAALAGLVALYDGRSDLGAAPRAAKRKAEETLDAVERLRVFERAALAPLDARAVDIVRDAAAQMATITALAPSLLLDAAAAVYLNLRMIRRLAELYGGRGGALGSLRLARKVVEHAMATGLIALGDDVLEPLMGGGLASKLSRRLGEGVVNGAMTARIGLAAMEVCRPMPFDAAPRPRLRDIAWAALGRGARGADQTSFKDQS